MGRITKGQKMKGQNMKGQGMRGGYVKKSRHLNDNALKGRDKSGEHHLNTTFIKTKYGSEK